MEEISLFVLHVQMEKRCCCWFPGMVATVSFVLTLLICGCDTVIVSVPNYTIQHVYGKSFFPITNSIYLLKCDFVNLIDEID